MELFSCIAAIDWQGLGSSMVTGLLNNLSGLVVSAVSIIITTKIVPWFTSQKKLNDQAHAHKEENHQLDVGYKAKDELLTDIPAVILEVKQTYLDSLKAGKDPNSEGGVTLTDAEKATAKKTALDKIYKLVPAAAQKGLSLVLGDVPAWLETQLEANVQVLKLKEAELPKVLEFDPSKTSK